jgi:SAM-dependent methyltransferase
MLRFEARNRTARRAPARPAPVRRPTPARQAPARPAPRRLTSVPPASAGLASGQLAEVRALDRILPRRVFGQAVYVGAAEDPFSAMLRDRARQVTVAGPGPLDVEDASADLVVLVSVLDRRPADDLDGDLAEVARILRPGALAVIGAANVLYRPGRRRYRGSRQARTESPAAAGPGGRVGHHPERLMLQLAVCGLQVERMLSAAGLAHPAWDRVLPWRVTQAAEYAAQAALATLYAGPSLFFLARRRDLT